MADPKRILLYYPSIVVRNPEWIRKSILYWDEIGAIVPQDESARSLINGNKDITELIINEVFSPFSPEPYVSENVDFVGEFISTIESDRFERYLAQDRSSNGIDLYKVKMHGRLADYLIDKGLGRMKWGSSLINVNRNVGYLYMSLLAESLANASRDFVIPGTDYDLYQTLLYKAEKEDNGIPGMSLNLQNLLPSPRSDVPIKKILKFKDKHRSELLKFNKFLHDYQKSLISIGNPKELKEQLFFFSKELEVNLHELLGVAQSEKVPMVLGAVETIFKIEAPAILGALALGVTIPSEISVGGSLVAGAVSLSKYMLDKRNENKQRLVNNPYSFLYQAKQEGII